VDIVSTVTDKGVEESRFDLKVGDEVVPGLRWQPEGASGPRPTVLIGHGGTSHKRTPYVLSLARRLVRHRGYTAIALDAPDHGERIANQEAAEKTRRGLERRLRTGGASGEAQAFLQLSEDQATARRDMTRQAIGEWKALLDDLANEPDLAAGPFGYWGVSMGTAIGLPFVAREPRITAAVLGLASAGGGFGSDAFLRAAGELTIPILFVFQWDDELMTRDGGIALFDAIGSKHKTMHINPGGHVELPPFEMEASEDFFARHL
jgi:dienelactone hydrolase